MSELQACCCPLAGPLPRKMLVKRRGGNTGHTNEFLAIGKRMEQQIAADRAADAPYK